MTARNDDTPLAGYGDRPSARVAPRLGRPGAAARKDAHARITCEIQPADLRAHLFKVSLRIPRPAALQEVSLPVWIPGSYLVREFARHLQRLEARQNGRSVPLQQLDKSTWQVACKSKGDLELSYEVYAFDGSVRAAFLDANRGFFNGTSVFLRVHGREAEPHRVEIGGLPKSWHVATALPAVKTTELGIGTYEAADYDELVDHPVEMGTFWRGRFPAGGVEHEFVVAGAPPSFDGQRLLRDVQRVVEAEIAFWHGRKKPPFARYVFLLNAVDDNYGGLEHRASTALICARRDLPRHGDVSSSEGYVGLLGLIGHEYFHAWSVKRLRPAEFARYDYERENHTELLWFFEGFTSYYDDLFLVRTSLIDEARYLKLLSKSLNNTLSLPGRHLQSVAQSSFDAWTKYYRQDENSPNSTTSYYIKGSLVALALDLTLRREGRGSLDEVMRLLWAGSGGGPIAESDIAAALEKVGGRSYEKELAAWVHGTQDLPLRELLEAFGVSWRSETPTWPLRLGMRVTDGASVQVKVVLNGSAAERAGVAPGDELLAVDDWRIRRLDDLALYAAAGSKFPVELLVSRDQRLKRIYCELPAGEGAISVSPRSDAAGEALALRQAWMNRH